MELTPDLVSQVREGRVVLVLGSGALAGAKLPAGQTLILGDDLRDLLADKFLGGKHKCDTLAWVAGLAISARDLSTVQNFLADCFKDITPAEYHKLLPTFKWRAIATTNYDRLIEETYTLVKDPVQNPVTFLSDRDRVDDKLRTQNNVALVKLHGCVTRTNDPNLPLILTTEQYVTHLKLRRRLFDYISNTGYECPLVFIGHSMRDPDIRAVIMKITEDLGIDSRPRYYLVKPSPDTEEINFWGERKITVLSGTFEDFLRALDWTIPSATRALAAVVRSDHPIKRHYVVHDSISTLVSNALSVDIEYLHAGTPIPEGNSTLFYRGADLGWFPISQRMDVRRTLTDKIINDVILPAEKERESGVELFVVLAEAGAGKTVFLRRLAWEAALEAEVLCLYLRRFGNLRYEPLKELHAATKTRLFVFVDDAGDHVQEMQEVVERAKQDELPITIVTAERANEWNMHCECLAAYSAPPFELRYLSHDECGLLVDLLNKHGSLGPNLKGKARDECIREFEERAGRQLLVALHEVTMGDPFEDIIYHEYQSIIPQQAQNLYLTVCVMNRLGVPVRAGLISRIHDIGFEQFKAKLFRPLEKVLLIKQNDVIREYMYTARHPEIAEIVFQRALQSPTERLREYMGILTKLNISFSSDRGSFRGLMRAKTLHELFPRYEDVRDLFDTAKEAVGKDAYLLQQMANYERIRPNGNIQVARDLLNEAHELDPRDNSILHTLSEVIRSQASQTDDFLVRQRLRREARALLAPLTDGFYDTAYAFVTLIKLALDETRDLLRQGGAGDREIDDSIRRVEQLLLRAKQKHPFDSHILSLESELAIMLKDDQGAMKALRRAFDADPRDSYTALRLSKILSSRGDIEGASKILEKAIQRNRSDKDLNYEYAKALMRVNPSDEEKLQYFFRRAFTKWDDHYDAQFWYARYAFMSTNVEKHQESVEVFAHLREQRFKYEDRFKIRDVMMDGGHRATIGGEIVTVFTNYGFVRLDRSGYEVIFHRDHTDHDTWPNLSSGTHVQLQIGFAYAGPQTIKLVRAPKKLT